MKKFLTLFIILFCLSISVFANMKIIPLSSSIYSDMDALYQVNGLSSASNARPWSAREAEMIFKKIDKSTLQTRYYSLYERIENIINEELDLQYDEYSSGSFNGEMNLEGYYHTNSDFAMEDDWLYSYEERRPFLKLEVEYALKDYAYLYADFRYAKSRTHSTDTARHFNDLFLQDGDKGGLGAVIPAFPAETTDEMGTMLFNSVFYSDKFNTNFLINDTSLATGWPNRALMAVGGETWTLMIARDKMKWGNGKIGNFIIDSHSIYNDFIRLSMFSPNYKFDYTVLSFGTNYSEGNSLPDEYFKLLLAHRFEFRIFDKATLAFSENIAYQGTSFDVRYLNPANFFHNHEYRAMFNAIAHLELDVALPLGLKGYFQFVMDQVRAPAENNSQGNAMGFLAGINYVNIFENTHRLTLNAEFAFTDPLLYRRDLVDFINLRRTHTERGDEYTYHGYTTQPEYIGFKYGGDALIFQLDASYEITDVLNLSGQFFYMKHGKMNFFTSHNKDGNNSKRPNYQHKAISGEDSEIETTIATSLGFDYKIPLNISFMNMIFYSDISYIAKHNKLVYNPNGRNETTFMNLNGWSNDFQLSFGLTIKI